jgi:hypothetical protein
MTKGSYRTLCNHATRQICHFMGRYISSLSNTNEMLGGVRKGGTICPQVRKHNLRGFLIDCRIVRKKKC